MFGVEQTLALGIACAGTGLQDAVEILEPMTKDSVDFVAKGAFHRAWYDPRSTIRSCFVFHGFSPVFIHQDCLGQARRSDGEVWRCPWQGLIDAGGRNTTISLQSSAGSKNTSAIVGMVLFCQFWYWLSLAHCACLAFNPTAIIGINGELQVRTLPIVSELCGADCPPQTPRFEFVSNAKPSLFAYPSSTKPAKKEAITRVATAVLSTTAKVKAREKKKAAAEASPSMWYFNYHSSWRFFLSDLPPPG